MQTLLNILGNIGFDWKVALANLVNFLVIFWLLNKFIFSKIRVALDNRKKTIEQGVLDAEEAGAQLVMAEEKKKGILSDARMEANMVFDEAHKKAKRTIKDSVLDAEKEAKKVMTDAENKIEMRRKETEKEIQKQTTQMVVESVKKVLESEVDSAMQERITKQITL